MQSSELVALGEALTPLEYALKLWAVAHKRGPQFYQRFLAHSPLALEHLGKLREGFDELTRVRGGFVYVCTHDAFPGKVKIGTTRKDVGTRIRSLRTAGVVGSHVLQGSVEHFDASGLEARLHAYFRPMRAEREWFKARTDMALVLLARFREEDMSLRSALGA